MSLSLKTPFLADVSTTLTIRIPKKAKEGEQFTVTGLLRREDNNRALPNQKIELYINETHHGTEITNRQGRVAFTLSIDEYGTYTIMDEFEGITEEE